MSIHKFLEFERYGDRIAFVEQGLYRSRSFTYREMADGMWRVASALQDQGVAAGDRVILWGANTARWAMTFYGCVLIGAVCVPIDASFSQTFVDKIGEKTQARIVLWDGDPASWDAILSVPRRSLQPAKLPPESLLEIIYTSGTTGDPKGVMITHGNLLSNLEPVHREIQKYRKYAFPFQPLGFVHLIPLSHLFGQIMGLFIPQMLSGKVIFCDPAPSGVARAAKRHRASAVICVPQELALLRTYVATKHSIDPAKTQPVGKFWKRWWRYRRIHSEFGWKFWAFISGGASLPQIDEDFWSRLGFAVIQGYGLTETAPSVTITHPFKGIKRGSVGKKLPGLDVRIADDGEILVRGGNVSPGYYQNEEATREVFRDGWLHTGDIGEFDEQGNLLILGRKKEVIVTANGLNVYPGDVEAVLEQDPHVHEAAVVAREEGGRPIIHAVLVLKATAAQADVSSIVKGANEKLEGHQRVQSSSIWPESHLPRTSTGKLMRNAVARGTLASSMRDRKPEDLFSRVMAGGSLRLEEDLGLSSLDRVELMMELEQRTGIPVDAAAFASARTASDVAALAGGTQIAGIKSSYPIRKWATYHATIWLRIVSWHLLAFPAMAIRRIRVRSQGAHNLEKVKLPCLFVANHQSVLDVPAILKTLPLHLKRRLAPAMGVGRSEFENLTAAFFFNTYLLPGTSAGLREALQHTGELADRAFCPLVFPEGARTPDGKLQRFRPGIGTIVAHTRLPVVPVLVRGAFEAWPAGARRPRPGEISVTFGEPIDFSGKTPAEIVSALESLFRAWAS